jgi:hypothetical protein
VKKGDIGAERTVCLGGACEYEKRREEMHLGWGRTIRDKGWRRSRNIGTVPWLRCLYI